MKKPINPLGTTPRLNAWLSVSRLSQFAPLMAVVLLFSNGAIPQQILGDPQGPQPPSSDKIDVNSTDARIAAPYSVTDTVGPNAKLYRYLGDPIAPPRRLDPAYSPSGIHDAVISAAKKAGVTVKVLTMDISEFPYLIAISCDDRSFQKLKAEFKEMGDYEYTGSVTSGSLCIFNITPIRAIPAEVRVTGRRRITLRMSVLYREIEPERTPGQ
jgi:hypothetical protein